MEEAVNDLKRKRPRCTICDRLLDDPEAPVRSIPCGGDCLQCMADAADPDAITAMNAVDPERYPARDE